MACKERDEIVGKQFIAVEGDAKLTKKEFEHWKWISGVVRAVTDRNHRTSLDVQILIEEDGKSWPERRWIKIHEECQYLAVEKALVWAPIPDQPGSPSESDNVTKATLSAHTYVPCLSFMAIVNKTDIYRQPKRPVKSLLEGRLHFSEQRNITPYQEVSRVTGPVDEGAEQTACVTRWRQEQDGQRLLMTTPSILVGYRVQVYRPEGTTQWYTAVIHSYSDKTHELEVTDDTVLEEHTEDPATLHVRLIGHGVVDSILSGEDSRIRPSRTRRSLENKTPPQAASAKPGGRRGQSQSPCTVRSSTPQAARKHPASRPTTPQESSKSQSGWAGEKTKKRKVDNESVTKPASLDSSNSDTSSPKRSNSTLNSFPASTPKRSLVVPLVDISTSPSKATRDSKAVLSSNSKPNSLNQIKESSLKKPDSIFESSDRKGNSLNLQNFKQVPVTLAKNSVLDNPQAKGDVKSDNVAGIKSPDSPKQPGCDHSQETESNKTRQKTRQLISEKFKEVKTKHSTDNSSASSKPVKKPQESVKKSRESNRKKAHKTSSLSSEPSDKQHTTASSQSSSHALLAVNKTSKQTVRNSNFREVGISDSCLLSAKTSSVSSVSAPVPSAKTDKTCASNPSQSSPNASDSSAAKTPHSPSLTRNSDKIAVSREQVVNSKQNSIETPPSLDDTKCESERSQVSSSNNEHIQRGTISENKSTTVIHSDSVKDSKLKTLSAVPLSNLNSVNKDISHTTNSVTVKCVQSEPSSETAQDPSKPDANQSSVEPVNCISISKDSVASKAHKTNAFKKLLQKQCPAIDYNKVNIHSIECKGTKAAAVDSKDMHYKKYLLGDYQKKEGGQTSPVTADQAEPPPRGESTQQGINLNQSLTDQLKRHPVNKGEPHRSWEQERCTSAPGVSGRSNGVEASVSSYTRAIGPSETAPISSAASSRSSDNHSQQTSVVSATVRDARASNSLTSYDKLQTSTLQQQSHMDTHGERGRGGPDVKPGTAHTHRSHSPSIRGSDLVNSERKINERDSTGGERKASPLVFDKSKRVEPYRDPELLKRDEMQRFAALQSQQRPTPPSGQGSLTATQSALPLTQASVSQLAAAAAAAQSASASVALPGLATTRPQGLLGLSGFGASALPAPLSLHHFTGSALDSATLSSLSVLQQQAAVAQLHQLQLLQAQQPHLMPYAALQNSMQTRQLEVLWQQKYPNIPVPPGWILHQYQDELLRDVNPMMQQRDLLDRERRDRELAREREQELREMRDREQELRELREREDRERAERERIERDRAERDRQERDRQERERREREERLERERREKEAAQLRERERQRREILHESKAAADAVEQHFQESLRLATQKAYSRGIWTPSLSGGGQPPSAKAFNPAAFPPQPPPQHSPHAAKSDEKPRMAHSASPHEKSSNPSPQDLSQKGRPEDIKPDVKPVIPGTKRDFYPGYPSTAQLKGHPAISSTHPSTAATQSGSLTAGGHQIKHEPNFSLYGYPHPSAMQQMYISHDKLAQQGLKDEKGVKMEPGVAGATTKAASLSAPPPLVKNENKSVIVENKGKDGVPQGAPPHGHGSISQGTARSGGFATEAKVSRSNHVPAQNPLRVSSPQQLGAASGKPPPSTLAQSQAATVAMQQAYLTAMSQAGALSAGYGHALQQGLVPNPIYSNPLNAAPGGQHRPAEQVSPNTQKRRAPQPKVAESTTNQTKKPRVDPSANATPVSTTPPTTTSRGPPPQQGAFIDCFKTFVENTVTSAFFHDTTNVKTVLPPTVAGAAPTTQSTASVAQSATSKSAIQSNAPAKTLPPASHPKVTSPPVTTTDTKTNTVSKTLQSDIIPSGRPSTTMAPSGRNLATTLNTINAPGRGNSPGAASVSSLSSMQDTINRVANGVDTDSDTLSAPSPPLPQGSKDAPSPARSTSSNSTAPPRNLKKAFLQRYSDEKVPVLAQNESSNSSLADVTPSVKPTKDTPSGSGKNSPVSGQSEGAVRSQTPSEQAPTTTATNNTSKPPMKSPFMLLKENEDTNTSASEAEGQEDAKRKKKGQKRKADAKSERSNTPVSQNKKCKDSSDTEGTSESKVAQESKAKKSSSKPVSSDSEAPSAVAKESAKKKKKGAKKSEEDSAAPASAAAAPQSSSAASGANAAVSAAPRATKSSWHCERKLQERADDLARPQGGGGGKKGAKREKDTDPRSENPSTVLAKKPLNREPVTKLRKSQEPFLQEEACMQVAPKLMKCRECKQMDKKQPNIFCRFYAFRRLKFNPKGVVTIAGFSEPSDADVDDIELWYPRPAHTEPRLSADMAKYLMHNVGDRFCELVEQEKEAMMWVSPDTKIVWKRAVQGVREMCDVCDTTLFNMHWCCHKCGFVVCIDCYRNKTKKVGTNQDKHMREEAGHVTNQKWLTCSASRQQHEADKLRITQIIPSDVLWALGTILHEVRDSWSIPSNCPCGHRSQGKSIMSTTTTTTTTAQTNGLTNHLMDAVSQCMDSKPGSKNKPLVNGIDSKKKVGGDLGSSMSHMSPLNLLAEAAVSRESEIKKETEAAKPPPAATPAAGDKCSTLRDLLTRQGVGIKAPPPDNNKKPKGISSNIDDVLLKLTENKGGVFDGEPHVIRNTKFSHYVPRSGLQMQGRKSPIPTYTLKETSVLFPEVPHSWLDHGRLLRLHDPRCGANLSLFQQQWRRAQPVLVSHCHQSLSEDLWTPSAFGKEFGHQENDLVNCHNCVTIVGHKMKVFWEGFEKIGCRLKDSKGRPLIVKLKDWPPTEDFSELMPARFHNLMDALPLPEYTKRNGTFNLASRLPEFFVKPDLGPKMYNAYGSALHPKTGTTNLHLDVSDAVNLMVYVGVPDDDEKNQEKAAVELMDRAGCCDITMARVREAGERPGALWHIFDPQDADKIRELLNKVAKERGEQVSLDHDPIHDQGFYLDMELRQRLLSEYDVQGYSIVQFMGDAVFIPAGAPHQVQNLHSCIKAAEDFVSPENINHCFFLTQEFRHLSDQHSNHEDKLQIKNIIYHAVKDAVAVLRHNSPH